MKRWTLLAALSIALVAAVACSSDDPEPAPTSVPIPTVETSAPDDVATRLLGPGDAPAKPGGFLDTSKTYTAVFELVKGDEFEILLYDDLAPSIVENFINLSRIGFYDGVTFHRVIAGFMAQGGDPEGTGRGGPDYKFPDEFHVDARHDKPGILSMANSGANTNGSQFFITSTETANLDAFDASDQPKNCAGFSVSCHAVFGEVVSGMDVVNNIRIRDPGTDPNPGDAIKTIRIVES
jgi:cyclophilin family peptidyl-prolyl cis-trans isomerase